MTSYQLAEINIARMKGVNILDSIMQEFVDNLDHINALAESSEGFIWRLNPDYGLGFRHESKRYNKDGPVWPPGKTLQVLFDS